MTKLVVSRRALADIGKVWQYSFEFWGRNQADKYFSNLQNSIYELVDNPYLGVSCIDIRAGYRKYNSGSHVIFFTVTNNTVTVIRVLHQKMNFKRYL
jgi:toxin ParE1/3/4